MANIYQCSTNGFSVTFENLWTLTVSIGRDTLSDRGVTTAEVQATRTVTVTNEEGQSTTLTYYDFDTDEIIEDGERTFSFVAPVKLAQFIATIEGQDPLQPPPPPPPGP